MMADPIGFQTARGSGFAPRSRRPTSCGSQRQEVKSATTRISWAMPPHYEHDRRRHRHRCNCHSC